MPLAVVYRLAEVDLAIGCSNAPVAARKRRVADSVRVLIRRVKWSKMGRDLVIS
jgi:hypothetical protein